MSASDPGVAYLLSHIGELKKKLAQSRREVYAQRCRAELWRKRALLKGRR